MVVLDFELASVWREADGHQFLEYAVLLEINEGLPVIPIVICLVKGPGRIERKTWTRTLLGLEVFRFEYWVISLPDLSAEDYENSESLLAAVLSALMASEEGPTAGRKLRLINRVVGNCTE